MNYFAAAMLFSIPFVVSYAQISSDEYTIAKLGWTQGNFFIHTVTPTATIQLADPDMNKIPSSIDTVQVYVFSDSYPDGLPMTLYETGPDSGIFKRTFGISEQRSAPGILYVHDGDTVTAKYVDATLPSPSLPSDKLELQSTAFIGSTGPPLERVPASGMRIMDSYGNTIDNPALGEQIRIVSDITNGQNYTQKFAWIAQIVDDKNKVMSLGWIDGMLNPGSSFSPSVSWIPENEGKYTATMFVWESLDNPTALSPPTSVDFTVDSEDLRNSRSGHDEMFLFIIPQDEFKSNMDAEKLSRLHFYKIHPDDLSQLPRLSLLINMTADFAEEPVSNLKLRISDAQLLQYHQFFTDKCNMERPYAAANACSAADFAFEYDEKWYYVYNEIAPSSPAIEDSHPNWDEDYFKK